ncbi:hypothetical protein OXB_0837 [Bacillus sp. OxB-1]|uniref:helix-turn-helix domain-containing protein n=1 Tax=Bacillus sp. (strain OxB-1) TaxID=98228 RepID=UPI000581D7DC|nr:helix-turn-helix domain-containing protein [Bacillus sp. OxB-1]BAQ09309.1 hypothetical protein OXB_0837 [Bacillus sp. OxB-1]
MSGIVRNKVIQRLEHHLRTTSRQLIKIDTEEEAIQFLLDSFKTELYCDFVGVILAESDEFIPKAWAGEVGNIRTAFPLPIEACSSRLLSYSTKDKETEGPETCALTKVLNGSDVKTWFTVPLIDGSNKYGFCIIGFFTYIPLLEMDTIFDEFGKDVAVAIGVARAKDHQLKKVEGIEWISKNLSINKSLEDNIREFTLRAAKGTDAASACIYLYNDSEGCFELQYPVFGCFAHTERISIRDKNFLNEYFPFLEQVGGTQLTIPIVVDLKTIGVLHVERKKGDLLFADDDVQSLKLLSDHIAILLKNAQLYQTEKNHRERLQVLLDYQQALVKETVVNDGFQGVADMLVQLYEDSVILLDRFFRPLFYRMEGSAEEVLEQFINAAESRRSTVEGFHVTLPGGEHFSIWPINGVNSLLGYLAIQMKAQELDEFDQLTIELARNICSIQFIKQKLVLDANEQAKDTFMGKLLVETIEDEKSILQYANLFQWDMYQPHRVATLSITLDEDELEGSNLLEQKAKKTLAWEYIMDRITARYRGILTATFHENYLFIVPVAEEDNRKRSWRTFYNHVEEAAAKSPTNCRVHLGVGSKVAELDQYYISYEQSLQVLNVVQNRFLSIGYSLFEELGSYTILYHLDHPVVDIFMDSQLGILLDYSESKNIDLLNTLRVYLQNNGNAKSTSEELFIHRSSLIYRLEKVEELLGVDLNDSEVRFNLMMAYKLYDMKRQAL